MTRLNNIKETVYYTGSQPELDLLKPGFDDSKNFYWYAYPYSWVVYITNPEIELVLVKHLLSTNNFIREYPFKYHLAKLSIISLQSLSYLLCVYQSADVSESEIFKRNSPQIHPVIEKYISDTWGVLLFYNQTTNLLKELLNWSDLQCKTLLEGLVTYEPSAIERALEIKVAQGYSFLDIWHTYTINGKLFPSKNKVANKILSILN
jgi:hypothetical protein